MGSQYSQSIKYTIEYGDNHKHLKMTIDSVASGKIKEDKRLPNWKTFCFRINSTEGVITSSVDGRENFTTKMPRLPFFKNEQVPVSNLFHSFAWTIHSKLTLFNVYDNTKRMKAIECGEEGNLYAWTSKDWNLGPENQLARVRTMRVADICGPTSLVMFPQLQVKAGQAVQMCQNFGGEVIAKPSLQDFEDHITWTQEHIQNGPFWVASSKENEISEANHSALAPTNATHKNKCKVCSSKGCHKEDCFKPVAYALCAIKDSSAFTLHGMADSLFNRPFKPHNNGKGFMWASVNNVLVRFHNDVWQGTHHAWGNSSLTKFLSNASTDSYMIGEWILTNF